MNSFSDVFVGNFICDATRVCVCCVICVFQLQVVVCDNVAGTRQRHFACVLCQGGFHGVL